MLRKLLIGSSLLLAANSYAQNPGMDEDTDFVDESLDLDDDDDDSDMDASNHDLEWHRAFNANNGVTFHIGQKRELIALIELNGAELQAIEDTGMGFLTVRIEGREQILLQTLNVPTNQILAEVAGAKLAVTIPENSEPTTVSVQHKDSIEELSFFKDQKLAEEAMEYNKDADENIAKEDL